MKTTIDERITNIRYNAHYINKMLAYNNNGNVIEDISDLCNAIDVYTHKTSGTTANIIDVVDELCWVRGAERLGIEEFYEEQVSDICVALYHVLHKAD